MPGSVNGADADAPAMAPPRSVGGNTAFALVSMLGGAGLTAIVTLVLVRVLDPAGYGLFALATGIAGLAFLPADFGIINATNRVVAEHRDDPRAVAALLVDALRLKVALAAVVCGGLAAAAGLIANAYDAPGLAWPLRLAVLAVFGQALLGLLGSVTSTLGRSEGNLRITLAESSLELVATLALVAVGFGVVGATGGRAIGYLGGVIFGVMVVTRLLGRPSLRRPRGSTMAFARQIAGYAGALLLVDGALTVFSQIDVLLVGGFLSTAAVGTFQAPLRLLNFLHYPGYAIAVGIAPRYARRDGVLPEPALLAAGLRTVLLAQLVITVPTIVWARPIVDLVLGHGYSDSAGVLAALAPFTFLQGMGPLVSLPLNYAGEARRRVPIAVLALVVDAAIGVMLIPRIGQVGGAVSTDAGYAVYVAGHLWVCHRQLGVPLRRLLPVGVRGLVAAGGMAGVLLAFGTDHLSVVDFVAGGVLAPVVFFGLLVATRELTTAELTTARATVRRFLPGR